MVLLFCVWLVFGNEIADVGNDDSLTGNFRRLSEYLGPVGTLGAVTFVAYILGLVLSLDRIVMLLAIKSARTTRRSGIAMSLTTRQRLDKHLSTPIAKAFKKASPEFVTNSIFSSKDGADENRSLRDSVPGDLQIHTRYRLQRLMGEDMDILAVQLHSKREKAYDKYDKARTEAEFRAGIAIPLVILGFILGIRLLREDQFLLGMFLGLLTCAIAFVLAMRALHKQQEANEEIINAIIVSDIEFAPLTTLKDIAEGTLTEPKGPTDEKIANGKAWVEKNV